MVIDLIKSVLRINALFSGTVGADRSALFTLISQQLLNTSNSTINWCKKSWDAAAAGGAVRLRGIAVNHTRTMPAGGGGVAR